MLANCMQPWAMEHSADVSKICKCWLLSKEGGKEEGRLSDLAVHIISGRVLEFCLYEVLLKSKLIVPYWPIACHAETFHLPLTCLQLLLDCMLPIVHAPWAAKVLTAAFNCRDSKLGAVKDAHKTSMKSMFAHKNVRKDGTEGKVLPCPYMNSSLFCTLHNQVTSHKHAMASGVQFGFRI